MVGLHRIDQVFPNFFLLQEFPFVRYRAAKSLDATTMTTFRDLIPTKVAAGVYDCITKYKKTIPDFPQSETCELLILDRSIDQVYNVNNLTTYKLLNTCNLTFFVWFIAWIFYLIIFSSDCSCYS